MGVPHSKPSEAKEIDYEPQKYMTILTTSAGHKALRKIGEVAFLGYGIQRKVLVLYFGPDGLFLREPAGYYKRYYHNGTPILQQEADHKDSKFGHFSKLEADLKNKLETFKR